MKVLKKTLASVAMLLMASVSSAATVIDLNTFSRALGGPPSMVGTDSTSAVLFGTADIFRTDLFGMFSFEWRLVSDDAVNNDFAYVVGGDTFTMLADTAGVRGSGGDSGWHTFTVDTSATGLLKFAVANVGDDNFGSSMYIRDVTLVPEPETYAMLLAGLLLISFSVRLNERRLCS